MNLSDYRVGPEAMWVELQLSGADPWERIEAAMAHGWHPLPAWGIDDHDLGSWPLVVVYVRNTDGSFELVESVEGDTTQWSLPTPSSRREAIDLLDHRWQSVTK